MDFAQGHQAPTDMVVRLEVLPNMGPDPVLEVSGPMDNHIHQERVR